MRQAQLEDFGRGFQLRREAVADPVLDRPVAQHGAHPGGAARRPEVVIDPGQVGEDPLPPVALLDAYTGLLAFDDPVGDNLLFDLFGDRPGALARAAQDGGNPAFAQAYPREIAQRGDDPLRAQMLGLFVINHPRRKLRSEAAIRNPSGNRPRVRCRQFGQLTSCCCVSMINSLVGGISVTCRRMICSGLSFVKLA